MPTHFGIRMDSSRLKSDDGWPHNNIVKKPRNGSGGPSENFANELRKSIRKGLEIFDRMANEKAKTIIQNTKYEQIKRSSRMASPRGGNHPRIIKDNESGLGEPRQLYVEVLPYRGRGKSWSTTTSPISEKMRHATSKTSSKWKKRSNIISSSTNNDCSRHENINDLVINHTGSKLKTISVDREEPLFLTRISGQEVPLQIKRKNTFPIDSQLPNICDSVLRGQSVVSSARQESCSVDDSRQVVSSKVTAAESESEYQQDILSLLDESATPSSLDDPEENTRSFQHHAKMVLSPHSNPTHLLDRIDNVHHQKQRAQFELIKHLSQIRELQERKRRVKAVKQTRYNVKLARAGQMIVRKEKLMKERFDREQWRMELEKLSLQEKSTSELKRQRIAQLREQRAEIQRQRNCALEFSRRNNAVATQTVRREIEERRMKQQSHNIEMVRQRRRISEHRKILMEALWNEELNRRRATASFGKQYIQQLLEHQRQMNNEELSVRRHLLKRETSWNPTHASLSPRIMTATMSRNAETVEFKQVDNRCGDVESKINNLDNDIPMANVVRPGRKRAQTSHVTQRKYKI